MLRASRGSFRGGGFTLVELIFSLTIMAVIISYAVPHVQKSLEKSRVDMACANLLSIWTAERLYWSNHQFFSDTLTDLQNEGFLDPSFIPNITTAQTSFQYGITAADTNNFQATAVRTNSQRWSGSIAIDQTGALTGVIAGTDGAQISPNGFN